MRTIPIVRPHWVLGRCQVWHYDPHFTDEEIETQISIQAHILEKQWFQDRAPGSQTLELLVCMASVQGASQGITSSPFCWSPESHPRSSSLLRGLKPVLADFLCQSHCCVLHGPCVPWGQGLGCDQVSSQHTGHNAHHVDSDGHRSG